MTTGEQSGRRGGKKAGAAGVEVPEPMRCVGAYGRLRVHVRPGGKRPEAVAVLAEGWGLAVTARGRDHVEVWGRGGAVAQYGAALPGLMKRLDAEAAAATARVRRWAGSTSKHGDRVETARYRASVLACLAGALGPDRPVRPAGRWPEPEQWASSPRAVADRVAAGIDPLAYVDPMEEARLTPAGTGQPLSDADVEEILAESRRQEAERRAAATVPVISIVGDAPPPPSSASAAPEAEPSRRRPDPAREERQQAEPGQQQTLPLHGPGLVSPGDHLEFVPWVAARRRMAGGTAVRIGPTTVTLRCSDGRTRRIPHEHLTVDSCGSLPRWGAGVSDEEVREHNAVRGWTVAAHLDHAARARPVPAARRRTTAPPPPAAAEGVRQLALDAPDDTAAAKPGPLVVIPCSKTKSAGGPRPAGELYTGSLHCMAARAAEALTADGGRTVILSGRHGVLDPAEVIAPYDTRLGELGSVTAAELAAQAQTLGIAETQEVIVLAPRAYTAAARSVWPAAVAPLEGARGIGVMRGRLAQIIRTGRTATAPRTEAAA